MLIRLEHALAAWGNDHFHQRVKTELERVPVHHLPLQKALARSSHVSDEPFSVMVLNSQATNETIEVKVGVFYSGIVAGCNCADDPSPIATQSEYASLALRIDRRTGETEITLLAQPLE